VAGSSERSRAPTHARKAAGVGLGRKDRRRLIFWGGGVELSASPVYPSQGVYIVLPNKGPPELWVTKSDCFLFPHRIIWHDLWLLCPPAGDAPLLRDDATAKRMEVRGQPARDQSARWQLERAGMAGSTGVAVA
jgi:hypothetical protein